MGAFQPFTRDGIGVHTGERGSVRVVARPARGGVALVTARGEIAWRAESIAADSAHATDLRGGASRVRTVEHLSAALAWFGVTDARIEVDGPEIPILDGSAAPWVEALAAAGAAPGPVFVRIREPVRAAVGGSAGEIAPLAPGESPAYSVELDFGAAPTGPPRAAFCPLEDDFASAIAPARTFALAGEVEALRGRGLGLGGSLANALVIGDEGPLNPEGMRFPDEPARHKLLDAIGDLALLGGLPWARVTLVRPSHALNHALVARAAALVERG